MGKQSIFSVAAAVVVSTGMTLAQTQTPQQFEKTGAGVQSTKRDKLPVVTLLDTGASLTGRLIKQRPLRIGGLPHPERLTCQAPSHQTRKQAAKVPTAQRRRTKISVV
jgi:hypothetical protein